MPKERPIIFSGAMVRAILDGHKTQTRRVAKNIVRVDGGVPYRPANNECGDEVAKCPYGKIGDILWVRETWGVNIADQLVYKADCHSTTQLQRGWKPSIHMPRVAARLFLKIEGIRAERLDEITQEDAISEGIEAYVDRQNIPGFYKDYSKDAFAFIRPQVSFRTLWDSINAKRGYGWDENPFVYVIRFERVK
jgi:hypothetical protein